MWFGRKHESFTSFSFSFLDHMFSLLKIRLPSKLLVFFRLTAVVAVKNRLSFLVEAFSVVQSMGYGVAISRKFGWGLILGFRLFRHVALSPQQFSFRLKFPPREKLNALAGKTR